MNMNELFEKFTGATDDVAIYLFGKALEEMIDEKLETLKPKIEALDCGKYTVDGADRQINVIMKQNSTISADAVAELSEAELRKSYKLTETALKNLGRKDLIEKYKSTSEVKSFRVEKLN
jgi:ribosomal protein S26